MTLKQWHSNDRKSKINTRKRVKNKKKLAMRKTYYYYGYYILLNLFKSKKTTYNKRLATKTVADWELQVVVSTCTCKNRQLGLPTFFLPQA